MILSRILNKVILHNSIGEWLSALFIILAVYFFLQWIKHLAANRLQDLSSRTVTDLDDFLTSLLANTKSVALFVFALFFGSLRLDLGTAIAQLLRLAALFALLVQIGLWIMAAVDYWVRRDAKSRGETGVQSTTLSIVGLIIKIAAWVLLFLLALDNIPGVQITTLIASLGIGGIAVGLAVQSILSDVFASVSIALDKPFVLGDAIGVGDIVGTVEHIGLKSVRVRSLAGQQIVFSTSDLLSSRINNYRKMERRLVVLKFGVSYNTPQEKVARIPKMLEEIITSLENVTFDRSHFVNFGDFTLDFETVYHIETADYTAYMDARQAVGLGMMKRFEEEGIEFPFPTQTLLIDKLAQPEAQEPQ